LVRRRDGLTGGIWGWGLVLLRGGKVDLAFTRKDLWVGKVEGVGGEEPFHYGGGGAGFGRFGFRVRLGLGDLGGWFGFCACRSNLPDFEGGNIGRIDE
jgi:hypothetical protein